ncbi:metabotropic glutamate receptor 3-like isoform X2 [Antedon mediterranea]|uniref:metabotropic glutamate receptor 3-like isoform X2 n=1 Tax=Antedon mediterranea TaxID=105859 RepID=UPI003AF5D84A
MFLLNVFLLPVLLHSCVVFVIGIDFIRQNNDTLLTSRPSLINLRASPSPPLPIISITNIKKYTKQRDHNLGLHAIDKKKDPAVGLDEGVISGNVSFSSKYHTKVIHEHFKTKRSPIILGKNKSKQIKGMEDRTSSSSRAYATGDVIIGGLFPVHLTDDDEIQCGKIQIRSGLWTESMIYAIKVVNNNDSVLPSTTLGYDIRDDCSDTSRALQQTLDFIDANSDKGSETCSNEVKTVGVVGTGKSSTSKVVSDLLTLFKIPQISYSATAAEFSKKSRFPYFFRTVPSDKHQAHVMCEIAKKYKWNLVDIIYSNDNYGIEGREELEKNFRKADICVGQSLIIKDKQNAEQEIVTKLKESKSEVIFTFCEKYYISKILKEADKRNMMNKTWIACDSWANSNQVIKNYEHVVHGMLGVIPMSGVDQEFNEYLLKMNPYTNTNPFYKQTLEKLHNCSLSNYVEKRRCTSNDTFKDIIDIDIWSAFVMDSVYAFAYALDDLYRNHGDYNNYADYIKNVSFKGVTKERFGFDNNGDPYARYKIFNLQKSNKFEKVMEWDPDEGFTVQNTQTQWKNGMNPPIGRCSESCPSGTYQQAGKLACCWFCEPCEDRWYTTTSDEKACLLCEKGFSVNPEQTDCLQNDIVYLEWSSSATILLIVFVILGMILAIGCLIVYIRYRNTPTIKATSTELSYVLGIGVIVSFLCTFMFMGKPTDFICNARLVMMGVSFSIYVGALLMKTNRISRIFNRKLSDGSPSIYLNIKYQLLFIFVIVMILVVVQGMLIYSSPSIQEYYLSTTTTYIQCKHSSLAEPVAVIVYNLALALLCGYQAFRIRKLPGQFNDSRSISFTILTCCLIWFIFLASMFTKNGYNKTIISCIGFIANGLSALFCMFFPKVWIIYMHPEMNVRQSTINMKNASHIAISTNCTSENTSANIKQSKSTAPYLEDSSTRLTSDGMSDNFVEFLARKEKEFSLIENERDKAVEQANDLYKELKEMYISYDDHMTSLVKMYQVEHQALEDLVESVDLDETNIKWLLERSAYATDTLEPILKMLKQSDKDHQLIQVLSQERKLLKCAMAQQSHDIRNDEHLI